MKLTLVIPFILAITTCFAQRQNVYYLKNNGKYVQSKDSADYIRVVREPDSGATLYNVFEFYKNGKQRFIGKSAKIEPLAPEGQFISFYDNGKKKEMGIYQEGSLFGYIS